MAEDICPSAVCTFLPFGFFLLACDSYHDLRWCLTPSDTTGRQLKEYYMKILTPKLSPIPFPGFFFPLYVTYIFVGVCPDWIGWSLFALYIPLCKRYYSIRRGHDNLDSWGYVVLIRTMMALLTYRGLVERGCKITEYKENFGAFITQMNESYISFLTPIENITRLEL